MKQVPVIAKIDLDHCFNVFFSLLGVITFSGKPEFQFLFMTRLLLFCLRILIHEFLSVKLYTQRINIIMLRVTWITSGYSNKPTKKVTNNTGV